MEASHLITEIKGVGVKTTALFSKLHIETIKDLISYFPRGYDHYEEALPVGELCTGKVQWVRACIVGTPSMVRAKGMVITHAQAGDASGRMKLTWFRMPYLKKALPGGSWHVFRGMVQAGAGGMLFMEQPRVFSQGDYETLAGDMAAQIYADERTDQPYDLQMCAAGAGGAGAAGLSSGRNTEQIPSDRIPGSNGKNPFSRKSGGCCDGQKTSGLR